MPSLLLRLIGPPQRGLALRLVLLMIASALTESIGVVLLVPMLAAIESGAGGVLGKALQAIGVPLALAPMLALFVAIVALRSVINLARNRSSIRLELAVTDDLRHRAWRALLGADWRTLATMRRSDSIGMLIANIDRAASGINQATTGLAALITLGGLGLAGLVIAPAVTLGGLLGGLLVLLAYGGMRRRAGQLGDRLGTAYRATYGSLSDSLAALRTVKSLGGEARAERDAFAGFAELSNARLDFQRDLGLGQLALQTGGAAVLALLVWLAVGRWNLGAGTILPIVALFARTMPLIGVLQECWQNFSHARPAIGEVFALIDRAEASREPELPTAPPPELHRSISLQDASVQFAGAGRPALDRVSIEIPAGAIVAVTGPSGAGKSTLADILGGLISPDHGALLVDGTALDPVQRRAWRARVAYVQQDPALLADTVRANLLWAAPEADAKRLAAALSAAACGFVLDWPQGLDTRIGDGGRPLSGGERQRLMLARALLRDPALLILDEATSALDAENEAQVAAAIAGLKGKVTVLIIAHRGTLTELAERTWRLEGGRLVS